MRNSLLTAVVLVFVCFSIASCAKKEPDVQYYEDYWTVYFKWKKAIMVAQGDHRAFSKDIREEMKKFLEREKQYSHLWSYNSISMLYEWSQGNFGLVMEPPAEYARSFYKGIFSSLETDIPEEEMARFGIELDLNEIEKRVNSP